jgi:hypothetical protein
VAAVKIGAHRVGIAALGQPGTIGNRSSFSMLQD